MNKGAIQKFAIWARNELIAQFVHACLSIWN